ncbi:MAG: serine/threonine-protein kinase [bacterium]|nr:serine/threonine-protein kinase [bacterium]
MSDRRSDDDEAFLDEAFDSLSTAAATGQPPDPGPWLEQRPDLATEITAIAELATEICPSVAHQSTPPTVPGYEIVRELGHGGMGAVYLARQTALADRLVALKVMPRGSALSTQARLRFHNEAAALARIRHPNVVAIYEVVDLGPTPAYAMEWIDGCTLFELVATWARNGRHPSSAALAHRLGAELPDHHAVDTIARWGEQLAGALAAAHAEGLLHRDVKPTNVMLRRDGTALLTDFGLVRDEESALMTRSGAFLGTPAYASPEQLAGDQVDERSDVYSLGATLYHGLAGEAPFGRAQQHAVLRAIEHGDLIALRQKNAAVPRDLATIVATAMAPEPSRRYGTAADLGADLRRYRHGQPITARPVGPIVRLGKYARRNRAAFYGALLGGVIVLAIAIATAAWFIQQSRVPGRIAEHVRAARLAVLDPRFDERVDYLIRHGGDGAPPSATSQPRLAAALRELDAALALRDDPEIRAERETIALADRLLADLPPGDALTELAPAVLESARTWRATGRLEHDPARLERMPGRDRRCLGLLAVLCAADALCIEAWRGLDLATGGDPLIDAALGQVYRQRGEPALAWPRLEAAYAHFHEAGFLAAAIAEVALACGDPAYALRMIERELGPATRASSPSADTIASAPAPETYDAETRIHADALFALGRIDEARTLYLRHASRGNVTPTSHDSLARFFRSEGDLDRALHHLWRLALRWPHPDRTARLADTLAAIWGQLGAQDREALVATSRHLPGTFLDHLEFVRSENALARHPELRALAARLELSWRQLTEWRDEIVPERRASPLVLAEPVQRLSHPPENTEIGTVLGPPTLAADGRTIAFAAGSSIADRSGRARSTTIYVHELATGRTRSVPPRPNGAPADGPSERPSLSSDGRWLAFYSRANRLVPEDDNNDWDCFLYDLTNGALACVSLDSHGQPIGLGNAAAQGQPAVSRDGRLIAFGNGPNHRAGAARVFDRNAVRVIWSTPTYSAGCVTPVAIDDAGRLLANSNARVLPNDRNDFMMDAFDFGIGGNRITRTSQRGEVSADASCQLVGTAPDDRWLLFETIAASLATIDHPSHSNLLLADRTTKRFTRINATHAGSLALGFGAATNGRITVFAAAGLVQRDASEPGEPCQIWRYDHGTRELAIVSRDRDGQLANGHCSWPRISADGHFVVFVTAASNLEPTASPTTQQLVGRRLARTPR